MTTAPGLVGFAEQSVLCRACRRWFGTTRSALPREHVQGGSGSRPVQPTPELKRQFDGESSFAGAISE
jgi:hypothetical protein